MFSNDCSRRGEDNREGRVRQHCRETRREEEKKGMTPAMTSSPLSKCSSQMALDAPLPLWLVSTPPTQPSTPLSFTTSGYSRRCSCCSRTVTETSDDFVHIASMPSGGTVGTATVGTAAVGTATVGTAAAGSASGDIAEKGEERRAVPELTKKTEVLYKTAMCPWHQLKRCRAGAMCNYAHSREELQSKPNFRRTRLCRAYMERGGCLRGEECQYAHGREELRLRAPMVEQEDVTRGTGAGGREQPTNCQHQPRRQQHDKQQHNAHQQQHNAHQQQQQQNEHQQQQRENEHQQQQQQNERHHRSQRVIKDGAEQQECDRCGPSGEEERAACAGREDAELRGGRPEEPVGSYSDIPSRGLYVPVRQGFQYMAVFGRSEVPSIVSLFKLFSLKDLIDAAPAAYYD
eukprot:GHVS01020145.1.p1 GENE.GHVS01020145.1~~GHVS01020145.1.p1  ORF type:complete len:403 (-),score=86.60 GHVS01020145.1:702-1910(-)